MDSPTLDNSVNSALIKSVQAYIALVRAKMRDYPELNRLTDGVESSDRNIATALLLALDDYNNTPPLINAASLAEFPSVDLLVRGAIIQLIESLGLLQTRNRLPYADGQIQIQTEQPQLYMQWWNMFKTDYENKKFRLKQSINLRDALGYQVGMSTEYLLINGFFDTLDKR